MKYHRGSCRYLRKSEIPKSLSEAKRRYEPRNVCGPQQKTDVNLPPSERLPHYSVQAHTIDSRGFGYMLVHRLILARGADRAVNESNPRGCDFSRFPMQGPGGIAETSFSRNETPSAGILSCQSARSVGALTDAGATRTFPCQMRESRRACAKWGVGSITVVPPSISRRSRIDSRDD